MFIALVTALLVVSGAAQEQLARKVLGEFRAIGAGAADADDALAAQTLAYHRTAMHSLRANSEQNPSHPFVVQLNRALCASSAASCHERLQSHAQVGEGRYEIVSEDLAVATLPWSALQELSSSSSSSSSSHSSSALLRDFLALSPELKMSREVAAMRGASSDACLVTRESSFSGELPDVHGVHEVMPEGEIAAKKTKTKTKAKTASEASQSSPRPFQLRFVMHAPSSQAAWESFASFLSGLEEEFNANASTANNEAVVREIVLDVDERNGYHGARRAKARAHARKHGSSVSALKTNPHRPNRLAENYLGTQTTDKITGEIFVTDCAAVYAIAERLAARPEVVSVSRRGLMRPTNKFAQYTCDTGTQGVYSPIQTMRQTASTPVDVIGEADTGIDMYNCFFHDENVDVNYQTSLGTTVLNPQHRKIAQYVSFVDSSEDSGGHGTHVAGSLAGDSPSGNSLEAYDMNPPVKLAFFDIGSSEDEYLTLPEDINKDLFEIMLPSGARIFSNSWGSSYNGYSDDSRNVDMFMWNHPDTLVLFAAGNEGEYGTYTVGSPATAKNVLTVGASLSDKESWKEKYGYYLSYVYDKDSVAYFSSRGPTADNRLKPEILAPGYFIESALGTNTSTEPFCAVQYMAGTSMATPVASSFALQVRRYFVDGYYPSGQAQSADGFIPSGALVKAMMVHSAQPMKYEGYYAANSVKWRTITTYPSVSQGYGRLNLNNTLNFNGAPLSTGTKPPLFDLFVVGAASSASGKHFFAFTEVNIRHTFYVRTNHSSAGPLRVTMSYTDYPGSAYSRSVMMNKLSLRVSVDGTSTTYSPYKATQTTDNTQRVDVATPAADTVYAISVTADQLVKSGQSYALVVTGAFSVLEDGIPRIAVVDPTAPESVDSNDSSSDSLAEAAIITIVVVVVGVAVLIGLLAFGCFWIANNKSQSSAQNASAPALASADNNVTKIENPLNAGIELGMNETPANDV